MSAIFAPPALIAAFMRFFLILEQWHRLPVVLALSALGREGFLLCPDSAACRRTPGCALDTLGGGYRRRRTDATDIALDMVRPSFCFIFLVRFPMENNM
ncbi:hypothetical protein ZWY2020_019386 [Hordeum vulgare]|nr:hypothetical protein ZWY2020_019386 [Hordeum vulgare]